MNADEIYEWKGVTNADYLTYIAYFLLAPLHVSKNIWLDIAITILAVGLILKSCTMGVKSNPNLSKFTNFFKGVFFPLFTVIHLYLVYLNFTLWNK